MESSQQGEREPFKPVPYSFLSFIPEKLKFEKEKTLNFFNNSHLDLRHFSLGFKSFCLLSTHVID